MVSALKLSFSIVIILVEFSFCFKKNLFIYYEWGEEVLLDLNFGSESTLVKCLATFLRYVVFDAPPFLCLCVALHLYCCSGFLSCPRFLSKCSSLFVYPGCRLSYVKLLGFLLLSQE
jgi:hypothetical protein